MLATIGLVLAGRAGARMTAQLDTPVCQDRLLRSWCQCLVRVLEPALTESVLVR
jgi:hypothetical protein